MYKPITKVQLVKGGNVIKQGHDFTLEFNLFDAEGVPADITGAVIKYKIAQRVGGVVSEGTATSAGAGRIALTVTEDIGYGDAMRVEFTVTKGGVTSKFPANDFVRLKISPSLDNLEVTGVMTVTLEQFKKEIDGATKAAKEQADRAEEIVDSLEAVMKDGPVQTVNGKTGIVSGLAEQSDLNIVKTQLAEKAKQTALEIERARISNLVANAGDTDGNAELLDIRVGFDGITYSTAGEATRALAGYMKIDNESWVV